MKNKTLENLAKAVYLDFKTEWNIQDYPKLHDVFAVISIESSWDPAVDSGVARGLMQISQPALETINRLYQKEYSYDLMFNPTINLWVGIRYLRWLWRAFEGYENREIITVMAYNWGIGNVQKWLEKTIPCNTVVDESVPTEVKNYVVAYVFYDNFYKRLLKE